MNQIFRFCCNCVSMSLIKNGKCYLCNERFYVKGNNDDMHIRRNKREKAH